MTPTDSLLSEHDNKRVWCLSELGAQYLVFSANGHSFKLQLADGKFDNNRWVDTKNGVSKIVPAISAKDNDRVTFTPSDSLTDWVLLIRKKKN